MPWGTLTLCSDPHPRDEGCIAEVTVFDVSCSQGSVTCFDTFIRLLEVS